MPIAPANLDVYQWGVESVKGTALAATSKIGIEELIISPIDDVVRPQLARGVMVRSPGDEITSRRGVNWTARGPANFAELQHWFGMTVALDAVPVGAAPYVWTHTFDPTALPSLNSYTLERRISDGTNFLDNEWAYVLGQEIMLAGADGLVTFESSGFARRSQSSTLTAAQSLAAPDVEPSALATIFIDTSWANLGNTQVTGEVLDWSFRFRNGVFPQWTADGRTDLDFTTHLTNGREVSIEASITMLIEASSGQFATERTAAEASTLRAVQMTLAGAGNEALDLKFLAKHTAGSIDDLGEQDGQRVVTLNLQEATDSTNLFEAVLTNDIATLS